MTAPRQRALITGLIVLGIVVVGFFGWRTLYAFREFRGHRPPPASAPDSVQIETDIALIRDWMTIPYISRTYAVPRKILFDALGIPPRGNEEKSLAQLNEKYSPQTPGIVMEVVKAAILANQPQLLPSSDETSVAPATAMPPQP